MNPNQKKILAICGSVRKSSSNEKILKLIASSWERELDVEIFTGLANLPHFNPDTTEQETAASVVELRNKIRAADGVMICTPEYVFSAPAALKNALEWMVSVTVMTDKPTALIVASGLGEKTLESLTLILDTLTVRWTSETRVLIQGARGKLNDNGVFSDEESFSELTKVMKAFISLIG